MGKRSTSRKESASRKRKKPIQVAELSTQPYFKEDWAEWPDNVNKGEVDTIRCMWELPAAAQLLWILEKSLRVRSYSLKDFEHAILWPTENPVSVPPLVCKPHCFVVLFQLFQDVFTKLLLTAKMREKLRIGEGRPYAWWGEKLSILFGKLFDKWAALKKRR